MENIAFVTGADRGLGHGITSRLLQLGWKVYAGEFNHEWSELGPLAEQYPSSLSIVPLDVTSEQSVKEAASFVSEKEDHIDLLINNAGVNSKTIHRGIELEQDYSEMLRLYNTNTLGPLRVVEAFLPLLEKSAMKRVCFVSSEAGSINACQRTSWYGYCMSKASLNMGVKILFNRLRPSGFTFRLYHPGWVRSYIGGSKNMNGELEPDVAGLYAVQYFLRNRSFEADNPGHSDENRLVLRDWLGREWAW